MEKWQDPVVLSIWFAITIAFVLVLVISILILVRLNYRKVIRRKTMEAELKIQHQRDLVENGLLIQEKERERIASDLHDELIGKLTAIRLKQQILGENKEIDDMISSGIVVARRITHDLSPPLLDITPFDEVVDDLIEPWRSKYELDYLFESRSDIAIPSRTKLQLSRIIQEVITNADKHADTKKLLIHVRKTSTCLCIRLADFGKGMIPEKFSKGLGMKNLESRTQYLNGRFKVKTMVNKGTSFIFVIPLAPN
jgi:signal transduction histidine kinase